jgi:hypothetical protein
MKPELPTKGTEKTLTTKNPYLKGELTQWPTLEWYQQEQTEASAEMLTEALKVKQASESVANDENNQ